EILVKSRLIDRHDWRQAHRNSGEFPEAGHQPGMRIAGKAAESWVCHPLVGARIRDSGQLLPEVLKLLRGEPPFEERSGIDAGRSMPLDVDLIAGVVLPPAAQKVIESDFVQRRC